MKVVNKILMKKDWHGRAIIKTKCKNLKFTGIGLF